MKIYKKNDLPMNLRKLKPKYLQLFIGNFFLGEVRYGNIFD